MPKARTMLSNDNIKCFRCGATTGTRYLVDKQFLCIECSPFYDLCNRADPRQVWLAIKSFWAGRKTVGRRDDDAKPRRFSVIKTKKVSVRRSSNIF
jgi:hypothetical protein